MMQSRLDALANRIDQLEQSNRRLRLLLGATLVAVVSCGAATTTAQYKQVTAHRLAIFGAEEKGEVVKLGRDAAGGEIIVRDAAGNERVRIGADGLSVRDATGKERWSAGSGN